MRTRGIGPLGLSAGIVIVAFLAVALLTRPHRTAGPCMVINGPVPLPEIPEASGLAVSRRNPGMLWTHNDSGHATILFALDTAGRISGRVQVPVLTRDWEDISAGQCPVDLSQGKPHQSGDCLYIADIGDNDFARRRIRIYRVPEPSPGDTDTAPPEVISAAYADGPHNAEAMFVLGDDMFIVTKDGTGAVYKAAITKPAGGAVTFQRVGQLGLVVVSDAEASPDESSVVVRNDDEAVLYRTADIAHGAFIPYLRIPLDGLRELQGEGVALDGHTLHLTSEGWQFGRTGRLLSLRCTLTP